MKNTTPISITIADDHELYRDGLTLALSGNKQYKLIESCKDGEHLVRSVKRKQPDVILTDLQMPFVSGVEAIRIIHELFPAIKILVLSNFDSEYTIVEALEAGAMGYITKAMPKTDLFEAIDTVHNQHRAYYCKSTTGKLARLIAKSHFNPEARKKVGLFSDTEKDIIRLVCEDLSCEAIGEKIHMSPRTVEKHRRKIYEKMNVTTTAGIAVYAIRNGLYDVDRGNGFKK